MLKRKWKKKEKTQWPFNVQFLFVETTDKRNQNLIFFLSHSPWLWPRWDSSTWLSLLWCSCRGIGSWWTWPLVPGAVVKWSASSVSAVSLCFYCFWCWRLYRRRWRHRSPCQCPRSLYRSRRSCPLALWKNLCLKQQQIVVNSIFVNIYSRRVMKDFLKGNLHVIKKK